MSDGGFFERVGTAARPQIRGDRQIAEANMAPQAIAAGSPVASPQSPGGQLKVRRWSQADDTFWPAAETCERLEPAFYRFTVVPNIGLALLRTRISVDDLIRLPDSAASEVLAEFAAFWGLRERFAARGFLHKRGILLWGPPGSGKTASLMLMAQDVIRDHGGIVCQIDDPGLAGHCLQQIRKIEPERPIVALIEDLDALVQQRGENEFLSLLDGETQVDRIVYVATTNYPERLDKRFVDRPSRFDTIRWIGMPSAAARRIYLQAKDPTLNDAELARWVRQTEGFSIAHLRELVILVRCFDRPLDAAIARLEKMRVRTPSSEEAPDRPAFGILGNAASR